MTQLIQTVPMQQSMLGWLAMGRNASDDDEVGELRRGVVESYAAPLLEHMGIADRFQGVVAGGTLSERKPHPLPLRHLAGKLGAPVERCLMVGDSETDFLAAQAAGAPVVLVSYGYRRHFDLHAAGALAVIDRFDELLSLA